MQEKLLPLTFLKEGQQAVIKQVSGGIGLEKKLFEMGLIPGSSICNIRNDGWGPVVINVMGSRIALGRGIAQKIIVQDK